MKGMEQVACAHCPRPGRDACAAWPRARVLLAEQVAGDDHNTQLKIVRTGGAAVGRPLQPGQEPGWLKLSREDS